MTEDAELCPDSLYIKVTGKSAEELMPLLVKTISDCLNSPDSTESQFNIPSPFDGREPAPYSIRGGGEIAHHLKSG